MPRPDDTTRPQTTPPTTNLIPPPTESNSTVETPLPPGHPTKTIRILTLAAAGMACLLALLPAAGHDQLWLLYVARQVLHGVPLYGPQLWESNPPLIVWLSLVPATLAPALHLSTPLIFKALVLLLATGIAEVSRRLLRRLLPALSQAQLWSLAFSFIVTFGIIPARDFGQRDHLLALLCLPYLLSATLDASPPGNVSRLSPRYRLLIGLTAAIGLCLKPHHFLIAIAIEATLLLKRTSLSQHSALRKRPALSKHSALRKHPAPRQPLALRSLLRPEPIAIAGFSLLYLAAIRLLTPRFLTFMLPLLRDTYWAIGHLTLPQLFAASIQLHILAAITLALFVLLRPQFPGEPLHSLSGLLLVAGAGSTLAYYLQGTGWYYQQLPALSFFALALSCLLLELAGRHPLPLPRWTPTAATALALLALTLTAHFSGYTLAHPLSFPSGLSHPPHPAPVAILTTVVDDSVPPIATHHLLWAQRQNNLWTLPAILRNQSPSAPDDPRHRIPPLRLAELDRLQHTAMVEDLARWQPVLILVARCQDPQVHCQIIEDRHDDLLAWFQRDPAFHTLFTRYHFLRSSGPYDAYTLN